MRIHQRRTPQQLFDLSPLEPRQLLSAATHLAILTHISTMVAGQSFPEITVALEDAQGNIITDPPADPTVTLTLLPDSPVTTFDLNSTPAIATPIVDIAAPNPNVETAQFVNGIATFPSNFPATKAGNFSFAANADGLDVFDDGFSIIPGPATHIAFLTGPAPIDTGTFTGLQVAIEDQYGNVVPTAKSTITLSAPSGVRINGQVTAQTFNGVASFNPLYSSFSGYFHFTASAKNFASAGSDHFVNDAHLAVSTPSSSLVAGGNLSITVAIADGSNNAIHVDDSPITLTLTSAPAGVSTGATYTASTTAGKATFSIPLTKTGKYIFTATDGSILTAAKSRTITVTSAAPASLQFIEVLLPPFFSGNSYHITVGIYDQFGNLCINDKSPITLTVTNAFGSPPAPLTAKPVNGIGTFPELIYLDTASLTAASGNLTVTENFPSHIIILPFPTQPLPILNPITISPGQGILL